MERQQSTQEKDLRGSNSIVVPPPPYKYKLHVVGSDLIEDTYCVLLVDTYSVLVEAAVHSKAAALYLQSHDFHLSSYMGY